MTTSNESRLLDARFDKMADGFATSIRIGDTLLCAKMREHQKIQDRALQAAVKERRDLRHVDMVRTARERDDASGTAVTQAKASRTAIAAVVARVDALHEDVREMRHLLKRSRDNRHGRPDTDMYAGGTRASSIQDCHDALATHADVVAELRRNVAMMQATMWLAGFVGVVAVAYYF
jgi:hypothetical protein